MNVRYRTSIEFLDYNDIPSRMRIYVMVWSLLMIDKCRTAGRRQMQTIGINYGVEGTLGSTFFKLRWSYRPFTTYKENWSVRPDYSPPSPLWSKYGIGSSCRASCASQVHPMDIYEVCMMSTRTTREPRPCLTPPPDAHVHACIDAVAPSSPRPSHGCPA